MNLSRPRRQVLLVVSLLLGSPGLGARQASLTRASAMQKAPGFALAASQSKPSDSKAHTAPQLTDLAWLAGRWLGKWGPRTAEQTWMSPRAGLMLGTFRLYEDDQTLLIELFTLRQNQDGVELRFRHFTSKLVPWEKSGPALLTLESTAPDRVIFTNPNNGQPKRAIFIRVDQNTYISRSEVVSSSGATKVVDITFHRQQVGPARHR
jgi:Domain of unknown function (DUF6265)